MREPRDQGRGHRWHSDPHGLQVVTFGCAAVADVEPQALGFTYWFESPPDGKPRAVTIRFTGRRVGEKRKPRRDDTFTVLETVERVLPASGRIAITGRFTTVAPGEWHVSAIPMSPKRPAGRTGSSTPSLVSLPKASTTGPTRFAPVVRIRAPGAHLGAWPAFVGLGVLAALMAQALLAAHLDLSVGTTLGISLIASLVGLVGAKLYYAAQQGPRALMKSSALVSTGMCIQGFVIGAIGAAVVGALVAGIPVGSLLDATAPSLLFGMTIGRFGCFFGGCCAGRPTASRWGLWSSDRRVGMRRIPTQLIESAGAFVLGLVAFLVVWNATGYQAGTVFVGTIAAYTLGRQVLFPLRDLPRNTAHGRAVAIAASTLVLLTALLVGVFA